MDTIIARYATVQVLEHVERSCAIGVSQQLAAEGRMTKSLSLCGAEHRRGDCLPPVCAASSKSEPSDWTVATEMKENCDVTLSVSHAVVSCVDTRRRSEPVPSIASRDAVTPSTVIFLGMTKIPRFSSQRK